VRHRFRARDKLTASSAPNEAAMPRYYRHHTSIKALLLFVPIAVIVVVASLFIAREPTPLAILLAVLTFVAIVMAVFSTLIVEVTDSELVLGFAFGVLRRRIPLADIVRAQRVTLPWWYGTGVKLAPGRTTYLIWPGPAVAVELKSGRTIQIGNADADKLLAALEG
jgi:hypothetical protein